MQKPGRHNHCESSSFKFICLPLVNILKNQSIIYVIFFMIIPTHSPKLNKTFCVGVFAFSYIHDMAGDTRSFSPEIFSILCLLLCFLVQTFPTCSLSFMNIHANIHPQRIIIYIHNYLSSTLVYDQIYFLKQTE